MKEFKILKGDSLELLKQRPDNSFDSVVTDPPYGIGFMDKEWDKPENIAFNPEFWTEVLRVLKPGGYLLAFSGTRTYHRMTVAIEDAGFEIRDMINWIYGVGFPKSHNLEKAFNKMDGVKFDSKPAIGVGFMNESEDGYNTTINQLTQNGESSENGKKWSGWGTALKPSHEPIVLARKPLTEKTIVLNVLRWGTGGINIDESRVGNEGGCKAPDLITPDTNENKIYGKGFGKKEQSISQKNLGRFPGNTIHDESEEVINAFPDDGSVARFFYGSKCNKKDRSEGLGSFEEQYKEGANYRPNHMEKAEQGESGNPFGRWNKVLNNHPTVKPTDLMMYLARLITPQGGKILDPFNGSGSTGKAVALLNKLENKDYSYVGMELDSDYIKISKARIFYAMNNKTWIEDKKK